MENTQEFYDAQGLSWVSDENRLTAAEARVEAAYHKLSCLSVTLRLGRHMFLVRS